MARIAAFDRAVDAVIKEFGDHVQQALAEVVQEELDRVVREDRPSGYEQSIDGVAGKAIAEIEPFGRAVFRFSYHVEIIAFALEILRALSPVKSGDYKHSHDVFINGEQTSDFRSVPYGATIAIASTLPYARRLEVPTKWRKGPNKGQKRGWSLQAQVPQPSDSIYKHAVATLNRRYGNIMKATYAWVDAGDDGDRVPAIILQDRRNL